MESDKKLKNNFAEENLEMNKKAQRFIKVINGMCGIVGGVVFLCEFTFLLLRIKGGISDSTLMIGVVGFALCWWFIYGIKYLAEQRLINRLKKWAQHVVDTNYYRGKKITVTCWKGVRFRGPEDSWFTNKFVTQCKEMCGDTGMKIYYNYSWIMM